MARGHPIAGNEGRSLRQGFGFDAPLFADWRSDTSSEDFDLKHSWSPSVGDPVTSGCLPLTPEHQRRELTDFPVDNTTGNLQTEELVHLRKRVEELENGMRDISMILSGLGEQIERLATLVEGGDLQRRRGGDSSAPTGSNTAIEDIARSSVIFPGTKPPCASSFPGEASRDPTVPTSVTRPRGLDQNQRTNCRTNHHTHLHWTYGGMRGLYISGVYRSRLPALGE
eukprot:g4108.t1